MRSIRLALLACLPLLAACQDTLTDGASRPSAPRVREGYAAHGEVRTGWIAGPDGKPVQVTFQVHEGRAIFEGDIDLGPADEVPATAAGVRPGGPRYGVIIDGGGYRWESVAYSISTSFNSTQRQTILNAINHVRSNNPALYFVETSSTTPRIQFQLGSGCSSPVGKQGGVQNINLTSGCAYSMGIVVHEVLHSLGMWHEQSRCDRDTYVQINLQNVESGKGHNFDKVCSGASDIGAYDEGSIMHYDPYAFSANSLPTITSLRGLSHLMGQRSGMSATDVRTVDWMYPRPIQLSIGYPSNVPTISWNAYPEATHYQVYYVRTEDVDDYERGHSYNEYPAAVGGAVYGTSTSDPSRTYTGTAYCDNYDPMVREIHEAYYEVWAYTPYVPGGVKKNRIAADVLQC